MEVFNQDGVLSRKGASGKFYCGRRLLRCSCCDGVCGPNSGCNCYACALLPERPVTCSRKHELVLVQRDNGWMCDGEQGPGGCRRGITSFGQTRGLKRFRCAKCDYDLCDLCFSHRGGILRVETKCPSGHLLRLATQFDGWSCDGGLVFCWGTLTPARSSDSVKERHRCELCDFDLCGFCFLNRSGPPRSLINFEGRVATLGKTGCYYCTSTTLSCDCCDGRCGPNNGCNCVGCRALDARAPKKNREGVFAVKGSSGKFYCRRRILNCSCCDGYCGPNNGCNCDACQILDLQDPQINRVGRLATRDLEGIYFCGFSCSPANACFDCRRLRNVVEASRDCEPFQARLPSPFNVEDGIDVVASDGSLRLCVLCEDFVADVRFHPCGHDAVCFACSFRWKKCAATDCGQTIVDRKRLTLVMGNDVEIGAEGHGASGPRSEGDSLEDEMKVVLTTELKRLKQKQKELEEEKFCSICIRDAKNTIFDCGHVACRNCAEKLRECHICRERIRTRKRVFF